MITLRRGRRPLRLLTGMAALLAWVGLTGDSPADPVPMRMVEECPAVDFVDWGQIRGEIFVPPPKDAGDKLDTSSDSEPGGKLEVVKGIKGDIIKGKVVEISADGILRLTGEQFTSDVTIRKSSLASVGLLRTFDETATDVVALTNGDQVAGHLAAITPGTVVVHSDVVGPVKIARKFVVSIAFGRDTISLLESNFAGGSMEPWKAQSGSWSVAGGGLLCSSGSSSDAVYAKLDQKEAVTFVAKFKATGGSSPRVRLILFADNNSSSYGGNSVYAYLYSNDCQIGYCRSGSTSTCARRSLGRTVQEGTLRFGYDPKTGKSRLWLNSIDHGEADMPNKPTSGKYVMFHSRYTRVSSLRVLRGIVAPGEKGGPGQEKADLVEFKNKDRVSAKRLTMAFTVVLPSHAS